MNPQRWATQLNTFRLLQMEIVSRHSGSAISKILNVPNLSLVLTSLASTIFTFELALRTNTLWAAFLTIGMQTVAFAFFFIEPKYDQVVARLLLLSYLVFYFVIMFLHGGNPPLPLYWTFSFVLFAFVGCDSNIESFAWIIVQLVIVTTGTVLQQIENAPKLSGFELRSFGYSYVLVVGFSFLLDHATKMTTRKMITQTHDLEEANAKYDVILNGVGDGLITTDEKGIVEFVNKKASHLLRLPRHDLVGQPLTSVVIAQNEDDELVPHKQRSVTQVLATGEVVTIGQASKERQYFVRGDNTTMLVGMVVSPVKVAGHVRGAIMLFHDMSVDDQIDRAKSEFVSLASHQLRTPLNVVSWYVEKMLSRKKGDLTDRQAEYLHEIGTNNTRMIQLVSDLLNVSRVDLGRVKLKGEDVELLQLVDELTKEISPLLDKKNIKFDYSSDTLSDTLHGSDRSVVMVIIQNLLSNAAKYTRDNGTVSLNVKQADHEANIKTDGVLISVTDNGVGIPVDQQPKIFSKLFRAQNVQDLDVEGTGLGLYITRSFVEALHGKIWFDSTSNGTTFYVYLPYAGPGAK
jgi:signal transduction histidine kinase